MEKTKSEEEIIFPDIEISGYVLRPWSFGVLFKLSHLLGSVLDKAEEKNLVSEINESGGFLQYTTLAKLFSIAGPELLEIISITLGAPAEEIEALNMEAGLRIALAIYNMNKDVITNSLKNVFSTPAEDVEKEEQQ